LLFEGKYVAFGAAKMAENLKGFTSVLGQRKEMPIR